MSLRLLLCALLFSVISNAQAVDLGTAGAYLVLAGQTVTNTGPSVINGGNVGVSPGTAITGFPPGTVTGGTIHSADAEALQAQADLVTAYNDAAGRAPTAIVSGDLGGLTLVAGTYKSTTSLGITGTLTLDGQGNPDSVWIFQIASTLITQSASRVILINGAQPCNVFWQVGSSATLGTSSTFVGTIMALTSISATTDATIQGRLLARNGQVSLDTNTIIVPSCVTTTTTTSTTTTSTTTTSTTTTTASTTTASTTTTSTTTATLPIITLPIGPIGPIIVPILGGGIGSGNSNGGGNVKDNGNGNGSGNGSGNGNGNGSGNENGIPDEVLDAIRDKGNRHGEGVALPQSWEANSIDEHNHHGYDHDHYGPHNDQYENHDVSMSSTFTTKPWGPSTTCSMTSNIEEYDETSWPTAPVWTP